MSLKTIARSTAGFSGADLENLVNEAALLACLMVGSQAALLVGDDVALLLRAHHDLDGGFLDLLFGDGL